MDPMPAQPPAPQEAPAPAPAPGDAPAPALGDAPAEVVLVPAGPPARATPNKAQARQDVIVMLLMLGGLILSAAIVVTFVNLWRRRQDRYESTAGELTSFRDLYEAGELSQEEYDRILARTASKLKGKPAPIRKVSRPPTDGNDTPPTPADPNS